MIQLYFNGKPCEIVSEIVSRDSTDGTVCIRYAADHPNWPFPNYTWVNPSVLSKLRQSKHDKRLEALQGIEEAPM
jgi:hypothetical protein